VFRPDALQLTGNSPSTSGLGTGIGSLYCAGLLAKAGKTCVLLEQHYVAGGCTHAFHDGGFEFDTGLHYVGRMEK
jgi:all-trans-retinol 13,14-reductase